MSPVNDLFEVGATTDSKLIGKARRWSLANDTSGFAEHLMTCFATEDLESEEYEDLIEQRLYALSQFDDSLLLSMREKQKAE